MNAVTPELLERIARKRRFSPQTLEIAKRLFLYNAPARGLSAEYGVNLARIYAIRDTVSHAAQEERVPPGWDEVTLVAPKELIEEFKQRIAQAKAQHGTNIDSHEASGVAIPGSSVVRQKRGASAARLAARKRKP